MILFHVFSGNKYIFAKFKTISLLFTIVSVKTTRIANRIKSDADRDFQKHPGQFLFFPPPPVAYLNQKNSD